MCGRDDVLWRDEFGKTSSSEGSDSVPEPAESRTRGNLNVRAFKSPEIPSSTCLQTLTSRPPETISNFPSFYQKICQRFFVVNKAQYTYPNEVSLVIGWWNVTKLCPSVIDIQNSNLKNHNLNSNIKTHFVIFIKWPIFSLLKIPLITVPDTRLPNSGFETCLHPRAWQCNSFPVTRDCDWINSKPRIPYQYCKMRQQGCFQVGEHNLWIQCLKHDLVSFLKFLSSIQILWHEHQNHRWLSWNHSLQF